MRNPMIPETIQHFAKPTRREPSLRSAIDQFFALRVGPGDTVRVKRGTLFDITAVLTEGRYESYGRGGYPDIQLELGGEFSIALQSSDEVSIVKRKDTPGRLAFAAKQPAVGDTVVLTTETGETKLKGVIAGITGLHLPNPSIRLQGVAAAVDVDTLKSIEVKSRKVCG